MDKIQLIEENRIKHGYSVISRNVSMKGYKKFNNKHKKENIIFKLESNLAIYKKVGTISNLLKNLRLLAKKDDEFSRLYSKYIQCIVDKHRNCLIIDDLIEIRDSLCDYSTFMTDIYEINDDQYDFDDHKISFTWNDIEVLFESENLLSKFLENRFEVNDFRFNTLLIGKIQEFNKNFQKLELILQEDDLKYSQAVFLFRNLNETTANLQKFLNENYYTSDFVSETYNDLQLILKSLKHFKKEINLPENLGSLFEKYRNQLQNLKIDNETMRQVLIDELEGRITFKSFKRMPLGPVFYDLAYDFVQFPKEDDISKEKMNLLDMNKK
ncbi:hypothetical protein A0H76_896 [Hepatospora eriocheir]|uniref:Uncharacterized protein n=1 Tax=Hepatospora eriocheir TaxID=1081669 RepID=A0A1X0QI34_9MICR|nr:hypothetical protein A0H76_896 [Hepatospora eriocheir]